MDFSKVKYIEFDILLSNGICSRVKLRRICSNNAQFKSGGDFRKMSAQLDDSSLSEPLESYSWNHVKIPIEGYKNIGADEFDITSVKKLLHTGL